MQGTGWVAGFCSLIRGAVAKASTGGVMLWGPDAQLVVA